MKAGIRDHLISFERGEITVDDYGGEAPAFEVIAEAWARIRYGTGQERREAAQERASQAATFECQWNPTLAAVQLTDRIKHDGAAWDITSRAPLGLNKEIHFTAVRAA